MFGASTEINLHKDLKIGQLEKLSNAGSRELFSQFSGIFSQEDLLELKKTAPGKRSDSTIVNKCILFLYKRDIEEIAILTVKNKSNGKKVISPSKKTVISQILNERLQSESITTLEFSERFANVNEHIRNAINNIARNKDLKQTSKNQPIAFEDNTQTVRSVFISHKHFPELLKD